MAVDSQGAVLWRVSGPEFDTTGSAVLMRDALVLYSNGIIYALDKKNGKVIRKRELDANVLMKIAVPPLLKRALGGDRNEAESAFAELTKMGQGVIGIIEEFQAAEKDPERVTAFKVLVEKIEYFYGDGTGHSKERQKRPAGDAKRRLSKWANVLVSGGKLIVVTADGWVFTLGK